MPVVFHWVLVIVFVAYVCAVPYAINKTMRENPEESKAVAFWVFAATSIAAYVYALYAMLSL